MRSSIGGMLTAVNREPRRDQRTVPRPAAPTRARWTSATASRKTFTKCPESFDVQPGGGQLRPPSWASRPTACTTTSGPTAGCRSTRTRTVLTGDAEELQVRQGGRRPCLIFETAYQRRSAGFEINDLGYLQRADQQSWSTWVGLFDRRVTRLYQQLQWNWNWWQNWSTGGLPQEARGQHQPARHAQEQLGDRRRRHRRPARHHLRRPRRAWRAGDAAESLLSFRG